MAPVQNPRCGGRDARLPGAEPVFESRALQRAQHRLQHRSVRSVHKPVPWITAPKTKGVNITRVTEIGIFLEARTANSGHHKPFIERFFGNLKPALEGLQHGSTERRRSVGLDEDDLMTSTSSSAGCALDVMTSSSKALSASSRPAITAGEGPGITPATRWAYYEQRPSSAKTTRPRAWIRMRYLTEEPCLSAKTGLSIGNFATKARHLPQLIRQYGRARVRPGSSDHRVAPSMLPTGRWRVAASRVGGPPHDARILRSRAKLRRAHVHKTRLFGSFNAKVKGKLYILV